MSADCLPQEFHGLATREILVVFPFSQSDGLLRLRLLLRNEQGLLSAWENRNLFAGNCTERTRHHGAFLSFAGDGRDSQQLALRIGEEIGQTDGVVDVAANVGV